MVSCYDREVAAMDTRVEDAEVARLSVGLRVPQEVLAD